MLLQELFKSKAAFFDVELDTKEAALEYISDQFLKSGLIKDKADFLTALQKREALDSTGLGDGIAIPHALNPTVLESTIGFVRLKKAVDWQSVDNKPVDLIFVIATNGEDGNEHLDALSQLSTYLMKADFQQGARQAKNFDEFISLFGEQQAKEKAVVEQESKPAGHYDVVGITACPTGIAHTYMAQEKLIEYAKSLGMSAKIETQGRRGIEDRLTEDDIKNAKVIILAHDKALAGMSRFNGMKVIDTSTKDAIFNGSELIKGFDANDKKVVIKAKEDASGENQEFSLKNFKDIKGNLLAGVSKMLPFVVAGGIILGIGFLIDSIAGNGNAGGAFGTVNPAAGWFSAIGKTSMMMMVPVLGAYIAYTIVGAQGLLPGFIAGLLADGTGGFAYNKGITNQAWVNMWGKLFPTELPMNSGFIGAMVGAYLASFIVFGLTKGFSKFKKSFQGVRDIVLIPLLSTLGIAFTMFVIDIPLGYLMWGIQEGLTWLAEHNLLMLLGAIIGLMMCVDMGGPINKIAYVLGTMSVAGGLGTDPLITNIMAAAMAAGMIPPLGVALATVMFRRTWTSRERDAAKANWLMGAFFISEGAIPFMITDPKRIMASAMSGGVVTGLLVGAFKITLPAPHGGILVFPLLKSHLFTSQGLMVGMGISLYILAIVIGTLIMALILGFWKQSDIRKGKLIIDSGIAPKAKKEKKAKDAKPVKGKDKTIKPAKIKSPQA